MRRPRLHLFTAALLLAPATAVYAQCDPPTASFTSSAGDTARFCISGTIQVDASASAAAPGHSITQWIWIVDGTPDTTASPLAEFTFQSGYHIVELTVVDDNACEDQAEQPVVVLVSALPDFNLDVPDAACIGASLPLMAAPTQQDILVTSGAYWSDGEPFILPDDIGQPYSMSALWLTDDPAAVITDVAQLGAICIEMEHSFMGDFVTTLTCPNGTSITLHQQGGGGTFLGAPNYSDYPTIPGECWTYCFTAEPEFGTWADCSTNGITPNVVPVGEYLSLAPGNYTSVQPLADLVGCPVNGIWTLTFLDLWAADNGSVCAWWLGADVDTSAIVDLSPTLGMGHADSSYWSGPNVINNAGNTTASALIEPPGDPAFTYTVMDDFGCTYDTTFTVNVVEPLIATAGPDHVICNAYAHLLGGISDANGPLSCVYTLILLDSLGGDSWGTAAVFVNIDGDIDSYHLSGTYEYREYSIPVAGADNITLNYFPAMSGNSQNGVILLDQLGDTLYSALHGPPSGALFTGALTCNPPGMSFSWSPTTGLIYEETILPSAYPSVNTTYTLTVDIPSAFGCTSSDEVLVQASIYPTLPLVYDPITGSCCVSDTNFADYRWYRGSQQLTASQGDTCITAGLSGFYTARGYDANDCVAYFDTILHCPPILITQIGSTLNAAGPYSNFIWILDGDTLEGFTQDDIAITETGLYVAIATTSYTGCAPTDSIQVDVITSIGGAAYGTPSIRVSPVPNNGTFNVLLTSSTSAHGLLRILDMTGRIAYQQPLHLPAGRSSIPVSIALVSGVYSVEWNGAGPRCAQRIVVD